MSHWKTLRSTTTIVLIIASFALTFLTLAIPQQATTREEYADLQYGLPFSFVSQDIRWYNPEPPQTLFMAIPKNEPTEFLVSSFVLSWVVNFLILLVLSVGVKSLSHAKPAR